MVSFSKFPSESSHADRDIAAADKRLEPHFRRNVALLLLSGIVFQIGWSVSGMARQPLLVKHLKVSNVFLGLMSSCASVLGFIGPLFATAISRRFPRKKWLSIIISMPYNSSPFLFGFSVVMAMHMGWSNQTLAGVLFATTLFLSFSGGFVTVPDRELTAQVLPSRIYSRFFGIRGVVVPVFGLIGLLVGRWLLKDDEPSLGNYATCLFVGSAGAWLCAAVSAFYHEEPHTSRRKFGGFFAPLVDAAWRDHAFRHYLFFYTIIALVQLPMTFVNVYGFRVLDMPPRAAAWMAGVATVTGVTVSYPAGWLVHRLGEKKAFRIFLWLQSASALPVCLLRNQWGVYGHSALLAAASAFLMIAGSTFILHHAPASKRPAYLTAVLLISSLAGLFMLPVVGVLFDRLGYMPVFLLMCPVLFLAALLLPPLLPDKGKTGKGEASPFL